MLIMTVRASQIVKEEQTDLLKSILLITSKFHSLEGLPILLLTMNESRGSLLSCLHFVSRYPFCNSFLHSICPLSIGVAAGETYPDSRCQVNV
jgi:hypothetical protein